MLRKRLENANIISFTLLSVGGDEAYADEEEVGEDAAGYCGGRDEEMGYKRS